MNYVHIRRYYRELVRKLIHLIFSLFDLCQVVQHCAAISATTELLFNNVLSLVDVSLC